MANYLNIYKSGQSKNKKINNSWNTHVAEISLWQTNGRTDGQTDGRVWIHRSLRKNSGDQLIVLGILTQSKVFVSISLYYDKLPMCKISKPYESPSQRYPCDGQIIYIKVGNPRTKKLIVLEILTQSKKGRVRFFVLW